jgi:hypothetical protein
LNVPARAYHPDAQMGRHGGILHQPGEVSELA